MSDQQQNDAASADSTVQVRTERETRDTAAHAILDGEIDQETGEHADEVLEELEMDDDDELSNAELLDLVSGLNERVVALETMFRRILAEPQLLACGDKHFCNELRDLIDGTPPPAGLKPVGS